jgi:hypothetical protein
LVFWVVTQCGLVGRYQRFGGTYCLHLQPWRWMQYVSPKRFYRLTSPHGATTQNINIDILSMTSKNIIQLQNYLKVTYILQLDPNANWQPLRQTFCP